MRPNRLRELINAGNTSIGTHVAISWPGIVELIGRAGGIDYVEFVAEYSSYDLEGLDNFGRAVDLFDGLSAMIKVEQEPRTFTAGRAIGSGIQNVLFADVRTAADARECITAVRPDTPTAEGRFGNVDRRFAGYFIEPGSPDYIKSLEDVVVAFMIEKDEAVRNLEEILSVKGVDMIQFGPGDYSMSIGISPPDPSNPKLREAQRYVVKTSLEMGVQPRAEISTPDQAKMYLDMGIRHFCIGTDIYVLFKWWRDNAEELRKVIEG